MANILCIQDKDATTFWKGLVWPSRAVKFGYKWALRDGNKIIFWEDCWFGSSPLSIQFWDLYVFCREQGQTIRQVGDGVTLKLTFRRAFSPPMICNWLELEAIANSISLLRILTLQCGNTQLHGFTPQALFMQYQLQGGLFYFYSCCLEAYCTSQDTYFIVVSCL